MEIFKKERDLSGQMFWSCHKGNLLPPIWVVTRHQYGISALISQMSFRGETSSGVAKCWLFFQAKVRQIVTQTYVEEPPVACENIRFSFLFAAGDVLHGEMSATQRQKFHTDDANQCLHNKPGSHGVPNINLSNFTCLLVDFGKVLCSSANELQ